MRELVGKIPTKDPDVIQEVYLSEEAVSKLVVRRAVRRARP